MTSSIAPDTLTLLAKQAASSYLNEGRPLDDSIVKMAQDHGLGPHHVRRVCEQANLTVHGTLRKSAAAESRDRNIEFEIARPERVQASLQGGLAKTASVSDYDRPPSRGWMSKEAAPISGRAAAAIGIGSGVLGFAGGHSMGDARGQKKGLKRGYARGTGEEQMRLLNHPASLNAQNDGLEAAAQELFKKSLKDLRPDEWDSAFHEMSRRLPDSRLRDVVRQHAFSQKRSAMDKEAFKGAGAALVGGAIGAMSAGEGNRLKGFAAGAAGGLVGGRLAGNAGLNAMAGKGAKKAMTQSLRSGSLKATGTTGHLGADRWLRSPGRMLATGAIGAAGVASGGYVGGQVMRATDAATRNQPQVPPRLQKTGVADPSYVTSHYTDDELWEQMRKEGGAGLTEVERARAQTSHRQLERSINKVAGLAKVAKRQAAAADAKRDIFFGTLVKQASVYLREGVGFDKLATAILHGRPDTPEALDAVVKLAEALFNQGKIARADVTKAAALMADPAFVSESIPVGQVVNGNLTILKTLDTLVNAAREADAYHRRCKQLTPNREIGVRAVEL